MSAITIDAQARHLMVRRQNRIRGQQMRLLSRLNLELGRTAQPHTWNHI